MRSTDSQTADGKMSVYTPTDVDCFRRCFCPKLPILNYFIAHIRILQIHKLWQPFGRFIFFYDLFAQCVLYANNCFKRVDMQVLESTSYKLLQTETTGKWSELQWLSQKSGRFCWHLCITGPRREIQQGLKDTPSGSVSIPQNIRALLVPWVTSKQH